MEQGLLEKTGKSIEEWVAIVNKTLRNMAKS